MLRHQWFRYNENPRVLHSEPPGWVIMKRSHEPKHYTLHRDDGAVKPFAEHHDWETLAEKADRATSEI